GFTVSPSTLELAQQAAPQLASVAPERIREELRLVFSHQGCVESLGILERLGVYPALWNARSPATPISTDACAALDRLSRSIQWLDEVAPDYPLRPDLFAGCMAVLLDSASQAGNRNAVDLLGELQTAGYISKRDSQRIARLLDRQDLPPEQRPQRWLLHEMGELWPTYACYLGSRAERASDTAEWQRISCGSPRSGETRSSHPRRCCREPISRSFSTYHPDPGWERSRASCGGCRSKVGSRLAALPRVLFWSWERARRIRVLRSNSPS
ncbi:MAG: hypothetical protein EP299_02060, partial [Acidobacteria bacterium]